MQVNGKTELFPTEPRIEATSTNKRLKWLKIMGIAMGVVTILRLFHFTKAEINNSAQLVFWVIFVIFIGYYSYVILNNKTKKRIGQYIQWFNTYFEYKLKDSDTSKVLDYSEIKLIITRLDIISIELYKGDILTLDISDFTEYTKRLMIKSNFNKIKN